MIQWQIWFHEGKLEPSFHLIEALDMKMAKLIAEDMASRSGMTFVGIAPFLEK